MEAAIVWTRPFFMLWEAYKLWNRDAFYKVGAVDERHWGKPMRILPIQLGVM